MGKIDRFRWLMETQVPFRGVIIWTCIFGGIALFLDILIAYIGYVRFGSTFDLKRTIGVGLVALVMVYMGQNMLRKTRRRPK